MSGKREAVSLEIHPGYAVALKRLRELQAESPKAEAEVGRLQTAMSELQSQQQQRTDGLTREATALLEGKGLAVEKALRVSEELSKAQHRRDVLRRAIQLQEQAVANELGAASVAVNKAIEPEYRRAVGELAQAVIRLGLAAQAEVKVRHTVEDAGAYWTMPHMAFLATGNPLESHSRIAMWLREAVVHGFIKRTDIPSEWLARWSCYLDAEIREHDARQNPQPATPPSPAKPVQEVIYSYPS